MANNRRPRRKDSACVSHAAGSVSSAALHEAMTEGVDDREFQLKTRAKLLLKGTPASALNMLLPKPNESDLHTFNWKFKQWSGPPLADTYGNKPVIDCDGVPLFAELAMMPVLRSKGFEDAVWVDSYRRCFRYGMPPNKCTPPPFVRELHTKIRNQNGGKWAGCFDLMAWTGDVVSFVELKRRGRDRMRDEGWLWMDNALKVGVSFEQFSVCEWEFE
jgi:hypothetical protein